MVNILIADDNIYYAKMLMDSLNDDNIKVCNIATNGKEVIDILQNNNIDVVLLDLKIPLYNGLEILDIIKEEQQKKYEKSFIIISGDMELMLQTKDDPLVYSYVSKCSDFMKIYKTINNLVEIKQSEKQTKEIRKRILEEMQYLGYNFKYKGSKYLKESIEFIKLRKNVSINNLKSDVYPIIAKRNNTTVHNIKCNINKATEQMYYDCSREVLKKYFGFYNDVKPTVKTVIDTICNKI